MPLPVYIICSEAGSLDKDTSKISIYEVLEGIQIHRKTDAEKTNKPLAHHRTVQPFRMTVAWMKEENDTPDVKFYIEVVLQPPGTSDEIVVGAITASFNLFLIRLIIKDIPLPPINAPGTLHVEARIRRDDQQEWLSKQRYPILLVEEPIPDNGQAT